MRIYLQDTTLRDGLQSPGIQIPLAQRLEFAEELLAVGVDEIEAGIPGAAEKPGETEFIKGLLRLAGGVPIRQWCRAKREDLEHAHRLACTHIHISIPASEEILSTIGWSWQQAITEAGELLYWGQDHFENISLGIQDFARCTESRLDEIAMLAVGNGPCRLRVADTVGILTPWSLIPRITRIRRGYQGPLEFHGHNDLGLATANALAAMYAGADWISTTVNGLGERAGNVALAELALLISQTPNFDSNLKLPKVFALSSRLAEISGRAIPVDKPIVGGNIFRHESGIHQASLAKNPLSYQPFLPETVPGRKMEFTLGVYSAARLPGADVLQN